MIELREAPHILEYPYRRSVGPVMGRFFGALKEGRIEGVRTYVSVDGGMSDNMRPMLYGSRYEALIADRGVGNWPDIPADRRNQYAIGEIKKWLAVFVRRFFQSSQYKRSAIPNAPKVGSGGSLSPRSDYRAPSDSEATVWLADVARIPDRAP